MTNRPTDKLKQTAREPVNKLQPIKRPYNPGPDRRDDPVAVLLLAMCFLFTMMALGGLVYLTKPDSWKAPVAEVGHE